MYFEKGDYDACIADCDKAVERGRELRQDYKLIGKALARKGNALVKQDKLEEAVEVYHKALTEHRLACRWWPLWRSQDIRSLVCHMSKIDNSVLLSDITTCAITACAICKAQTSTGRGPLLVAVRVISYRHEH